MSRRLKIGDLADGNFGLRISKAGQDADANPPVPANLIFDSQWPQLLPIYQTGVLNPGPNGTASISFTQLGYIPLFSFMINTSGGTFVKGWAINQEFNTQYYQGPNNATPLSYIQIWVTNSTFNVLTVTSGKDPAWPASFQVAYVIYKVAG